VPVLQRQLTRNARIVSFSSAPPTIAIIMSIIVLGIIFGSSEPKSVATVERYLSTIAHAHTLADFGYTDDSQRGMGFNWPRAYPCPLSGVLLEP
jgi:hypothetical protein